MTERYAVYFAPGAESELGQFGQHVLCRSSISERKADASSTFSDQARWLKLTEKPSHYGFHATLKAPFELKHGCTIKALRQAVDDFSKNHSPIELTSLYPRSIGGFMALNLDTEIKQLSNFALNCVESFEPFRSALSDADLQRRKQHKLSSRQESLLLKYGYPYVADEFRFHLTLTGKVSDNDEDYERWVVNEYNRLVNKTPVLDRIAIFTQPDRTKPFVQLTAFSLNR